MVKKYWNVIYIDRDPKEPYKGWGWVEVTTEDIKQFGIPSNYPDTYTKLRRSPSERCNLPNRGKLPSRGRAGAKKL